MDKLKIVLATQNLHKVKEIAQIWEALPLELISLKEFPNIEVAEESGSTFQENALLKAQAIARQTGLIAVADDSGFCVDALDGRPGVYSARYAGLEASDQDNLQKVLKEYLASPLKNTDKKCSFVCAVACVDPSQNTSKVIQEAVEGEMLEIPNGKNGFGYDPLFYYPPLEKSFAQLNIEEKNNLSHRGKAFRKLKNYLLATYF